MISRDTYTTIKPIPNEGIVLPRGVNIQFNELAPGGFVPMVRLRRIVQRRRLVIEKVSDYLEKALDY